MTIKILTITWLWILAQLIVVSHATTCLANAPCFLPYRNISPLGETPYRTEVGAIDCRLCLQKCMQDNINELRCWAFTHQSYGNYACNYYGPPAQSFSRALLVTFGVDYYVLQGSCYPATTTVAAPTTLTPPNSSGDSSLFNRTTCTENQKLVILASTNRKSGKTPSKVLSVSSDIECVQKCISNEVPCVAVEVTVPNQCKIFTEATKTKDLISDTSYDYYEKNCLTASLVSLCPEPVGPFYREAESFLGGIVVRDNVTAFSATECLTKCIGLGLECASANYYPRSGNCLIKKMRRIDRPELFGPDPNTIYLENGCYASLNAAGGVPQRRDPFGMPGPLGGGTNHLTGPSSFGAPGSLNK